MEVSFGGWWRRACGPRRRGKRRWPDEVKALIIAKSLQPGARIVDVAVRHDILPHQRPASSRKWSRRPSQPCLSASLRT
ncbi:MAG: transposase [Rhodobacter sp.]|nr:transposase [Rhodobacter sp.]